MSQRQHAWTVALTTGFAVALFAFSIQSVVLAQDRGDRDRLNDLTEQQSELRKQIRAKQKQVQAAKQEIQSLSGDIQRLDRDISTTERKISDTDTKISDTETSIQTTEQEITAAQLELDTQKGYQDEAVRVLYETVADDPLKVVLGNQSISDVIDRSEYLTALEERITLIIEDVERLKADLEEKRRSLEQQQADLERLKAEQEAYKVGLATQQNQKELLKADAQVKQRSLEEQVREAQGLVNQVEGEMSAIRRRLTSKSGPGVVQAKDRGTSSVGFQWPTDYTYISTYFGGSTPFQPSGGHGGLDLVNVAGTPIYAAGDGTITAVTEMTYNGHFYAYGRYIVVGHNARWSSLYAHLQSAAVSPGDEVKRGDVIGYMGSTGWSTGPHLHFEIWDYDRRSNPLGLLP